MLIGNAKVYSIISGKGGVGKSLFTAELAYYLSSLGRRILIIDGDMGLSNIEVVFNIKTKGTLNDVINYGKSINDIITQASPRIDVISSGSGVRELNFLSSLDRQGLVSSILDLQYMYDAILIDTSSGMSEFSLQLASMSDEIICLLTPEPSSFTDLYGMIKVMVQDFKKDRFCVVTNMVETETKGDFLFQKFAEVCSRFLIVSLDYLGSVPFDENVKKLVASQKLPIRQNPSSEHTHMIKKVSKQFELYLMSRPELSQFWTELSGVA